MRRRTAFSLTAVLLVAACAHQPAPQAVAGMEWSLSQVDGEGLKFAYGQPHSDNVVLMMTCQPRSGAVLVSAIGSAKATPAMTLASKGQSRTYPAQLAPAFGDGALIEVSLPASDPILARFADTGDLSLSVDDRRTLLPADSPQASRFIARCKS